MNETNKDHKAFGNGVFCAESLTKREYFAALAMQTLVANTNKPLDTQAWLAVAAADYLIEELNRE